jgi:hypothetical protein
LPPAIARCASQRYSVLMSGTVLSILMLAAIALAGGGAWLLFQRRNAKQGGLMLLAALVMLGNVLIAVWPLG